MQKELLLDCIEAEEARLYDFVKASKVIETEDVSTFAVDNKGHLYVNRAFYEDNKEYVIGVLLHESLHIYFDHVNNDYDHKIVANIAFDVIINDMVMGVGYSLPKGAVTYETCEPQVPRIYKTSDEVYNFLIDNMADIPEELIDAVFEAHATPEKDMVVSEEGTQEQVQAAKAVAMDIQERLDKAVKHKYGMNNKGGIQKSINNILGSFLAPEFHRTYTRQPRFRATNLLTPSSRAIVRKPTLSIYLDVSSSMGGDNISKALGLLDDLGTMLLEYKTNKFIFNTGTYRVEDYSDIHTNGGTSFSKFHPDDAADAVIIVTDCEFSFNFLESHDRKKVIIVSLGGSQDLNNCEVFYA